MSAPVGKQPVARDSVFMFPAETFEISKRLLTTFLAEMRHNVETVLQTYELLIYGNLTLLINACIVHT
jgi:hypothetical protein